jgi:hypothetical protein
MVHIASYGSAVRSMPPGPPSIIPCQVTIHVTSARPSLLQMVDMQTRLFKMHIVKCIKCASAYSCLLGSTSKLYRRARI